MGKHIFYEHYYNRCWGGMVPTPDESQFIWDLHSPHYSRAIHASVAFTKDGELAGIHQYSYTPRQGLYSEGSWVWANFRNRGIAKNLWGLSLDVTGTKRVGLMVVSDRGMTLVNSLSRTFKDILFEYEQGGLRKLRVLK